MRFLLVRILLLAGFLMQSQYVESAESGASGYPIVTMGWLESIYLKPWGIQLTAKLDTGAKTSSLHATTVEHFRRQEADWVRFDLYDKEANRKVTVEKPLVRTVFIKERKSGASQRDVVIMRLCKNGKEYDTEITLVDRSNFNYPLLLGRSFLKGVAYVDSGSTFMYPGENDGCNAIKKK